MATCKGCNGHKTITCPVCKNNSGKKKACIQCGGAGKIPCPVCGGTGKQN